MKHSVPGDQQAFSPGLSFPRSDDYGYPSSEKQKETPTKDNKDDLNWQPYYFVPFDVDQTGSPQHS